MGSTPREHQYQIPLPTRSTDVTTLKECPGKYLLQLLHEDEQVPAVYFGLGSACHETIERTILEDLDLSAALVDVERRIRRWMETEIPGGSLTVLESSTRSLETMHDDASRMIHNWFHFVHPDSDKRLDIYKDYHWPPKVEVPFQNPGDYTWGSVDALFSLRNNHSPMSHEYLIVDWKSGARVPKSNFQLDFYRKGLQLPEARAGYHMLDRVRPNNVFIEAGPYVDIPVKAGITRAVAEKASMLSQIMPDFNPGWQCGYCTVRPFCPAKGDNPKKNRRQLRKDLKKMVPFDLFETSDIV